MLPASRRGNKYCRYLDRIDFSFPSSTNKEMYNICIDNYYTKIFKLMSGTNPSETVNKSTNHPRGARSGYDTRTPRYCWLNLLPAMFNTRDVRNAKGEVVSYTLEFRNHSASMNYTKIKNWILIAFAFVNYIENYKGQIATRNDITLRELIQAAYPKRGKNILDYVSSRKAEFKTSDSEAKEYSERPKNKEVTLKRLITE